MIRILLLLAALLSPAAAGAQPATGTLAGGEILRGGFAQERHLQGFAAPIRSQGTFVLIAGRGLIWQLERPFKVTTVITPAGLVQYTNGAETLRLPTSRVPALGRLYDMLGSALAGDWRGLEDEFAVARRAEGDAQIVTLVPRGAVDPAAPVKAITARVSRFIEQVAIERPSGDVDRIAFTDPVLSTGAPAADEAALLAQAAR